MWEILESRYGSIFNSIETLKTKLHSFFSPSRKTDSISLGFVQDFVQNEETEAALNKIIAKLNGFQEKINTSRINVKNASQDKIDEEHAGLMHEIHLWTLRLMDNIKNEDSGFCATKYASLSSKNKDSLSENLEELKQLSNLKRLTPRESVSLKTDSELWTQGESLQQQQKAANNNPFFHAALEATRKITQKTSCFFSYAWASDDRPYEGWTQPFLVNLRAHFNKAGVYVLLDVKGSRYGNTNEFMMNARDADTAVLFITDSLHDKLHGGVSSVCKEINLLRQRRKNDLRRGIVTFFPIILSNITEVPLPDEFERFTVVNSFPDAGYVSIVRELLRDVYKLGADHLEFNEIWKQYEDNHEYSKVWNSVSTKNLQSPQFYLEQTREAIFSLKKYIRLLLTNTLEHISMNILKIDKKFMEYFQNAINKHVEAIIKIKYLLEIMQTNKIDPNAIDILSGNLEDVNMLLFKYAFIKEKLNIFPSKRILSLGIRLLFETKQIIEEVLLNESNKSDIFNTLIRMGSDVLNKLEELNVNRNFNKEFVLTAEENAKPDTIQNSSKREYSSKFFSEFPSKKRDLRGSSEKPPISIFFSHTPIASGLQELQLSIPSTTAEQNEAISVRRQTS